MSRNTILYVNIIYDIMSCLTISLKFLIEIQNMIINSLDMTNTII